MTQASTGLAVRAEALSKQYHRSQAVDPSRTLREALTESAAGVMRAAGRLVSRGERSQPNAFWALRDVSFEVAEGEAVGLIGGNGAGKSTLLKLLTRVTAPTGGRALIRGRVGSLLEVGTGFHPDLSGRDNVFLNGAILGMRRAEIARKFDEIVAFAEVGPFIDTPVKRYSSGMYMRLAFAVAAHLEPDVLLVDEVLAVGDAAFQRKCLGKMNDVTAAGRTVLFVSHNMAAVQSLCGRALWLRDGRVAEDGPAKQVVTRYLQAGQVDRREQSWPDTATAPGNDRVRLRRVSVRAARAPDAAAEAGADGFTTRTPLLLEFEYWNLTPGALLNLSLHIYNEQGVMVFNALPVLEREWQGRPFPVGLFRDVCSIPGDLLNDGTFRVELLVVRDAEVVYRHEDVLAFEVHDSVELRDGWFGRWSGVVRPLLPWTTELVTRGRPDEPAPSSP